MIELTTEMMVVLAILGVTIVLFVTEIFRVDFTAILVMVALGLLSQVPGLGNLADPQHLFDGFASNAVISIVAVMIIGAGLDKTGLMSSVASFILKYGGTTEVRIIPIVSATVGFISSFMQNVGAAALFLPVISRISTRTGLPMSRLLMPMGFCAILGGTMTMVGSSPLILLNDLIIASNASLPEDEQMETFGLFSVAPIGIALVLSGVLYFVVAGHWVLPDAPSREQAGESQSIQDYLKQIYKLKADVVEVSIPEGHILMGHTFRDMMQAHNVYIVGSAYQGRKWLAPETSTVITTPSRLAILGRRKVIRQMAEDYGLDIREDLDVFAEDFSPIRSGIAEIVIPPGSVLIGHTPSELSFRKRYGLSLLAIHRGEETFSLVETEDKPADDLGAIPFRAGDTLVVHTPWDRLAKLQSDRDFVVVTTDFPHEDLRPHKVGWALLFLALALGLILLTDLRLSLCLFVGAAGMILSKVIDIDEAYGAVSWSTVFLLASLIPLGQAVQATGTAAWIAQEILLGLHGTVPVFGLQIGVAILATGFTLVMSNVGATVLLVPLAVSIAVAAGGDPAVFALTVAIATSNSFFIPTHQVNALIMGPGGYTVADFMRAGGVMSVLFLIVSMTMMWLVF